MYFDHVQHLSDASKDQEGKGNNKVPLSQLALYFDKYIPTPG